MRFIQVQVWLVCLLGLFATTAFADNSDIPTGFCYANCTAPEKAIYNDFMSGTGLDAVALPGVYSGECYHNARNFDGNITHYGVVGLDPVSPGNTYFGAKFSFFYPSDPYATLTFDEAKATGLFQYDSKHLMKVFNTHGFLDMNPGQIPIWLYWVRSNPTGSELYLLAAWDTVQQVYCRLHRH